MNLNYVVQIRGEKTYTELFKIALAEGEFNRIYVAVAYATIGGVKAIEDTFRHQKWDEIVKQWLVGIDWCRSDPAALVRIATTKASELRIPNGNSLVQTSGCTPRDTFHPKLFLLQGESTNAIICGSGNLSANGLLRGCECGSLVITTPSDTESTFQFSQLMQWFDSSWTTATAYEAIRAKYESICSELVRSSQFVPTEDDAIPIAPGHRPLRRGLSEAQLRELRTFDHLWIDAGALGGNLGHGVPGNQLDMTRYMRVFFRAPAFDLLPNTKIGAIDLEWDGSICMDRTLKFGDNGMDKLNVPPPGTRGARYYVGKTLLFTRLPDGRFKFEVGDASQRRKWKSRSLRRGSNYRIGNGRREWGLF